MASKGSNTYFHRALRLYGKEEFDWEVTCTLTNKKDAKFAERKIIAWGLGDYNLTAGGDGLIDPAPEVIERIVATRKANRKPESEETRKRRSEGQLRRGPRGPEFGQKISAGRKGKTFGPMSQEHKDAISISLMGRVPTAETCEKLRVASGSRKHTEESKSKMRESWKLRDHTHSEETKQKISEGLLRYNDSKRAVNTADE